VGASLSYPCCTFRGSVLALDARTGRQLWKTYIIPEPPRPTRKNSRGVQLWAPNGGAVWNTPTVDPKRRAIYVGTGNTYTGTAPGTTDAIVAFHMDTGKLLWAVQDTAGDAWLPRCENDAERTENCPENIGPDDDFGASPMLRVLPNGRRILVAGQKSGTVFAHDPDRQGALVWKTSLVQGVHGAITFGGAADGDLAYFGLRSGGVAAVRLTTGERVWFQPLPAQAGGRGQTAAVSAIPGVVFSGDWEGVLRALAAADGRVLWEYKTGRRFETVNHVEASGGSMGAPGAVIVEGMLFVGSGYSGGGGRPGNVLLAFSVEESPRKVSERRLD
jgi:polyvinyl alcohol dehydrogenase (cytochrome)